MSVQALATPVNRVRPAEDTRPLFLPHSLATAPRSASATETRMVARIGAGMALMCAKAQELLLQGARGDGDM